MIEWLTSNRAEIRAMCERFGVSRIEMFGSAARGDVDPGSSDLDFMVEFLDYGPGIADRYFGFLEAMEDHFGQKIDTVFGPKVKSDYFQKEIDRTREVVYEAPRRRVAA